MVPQQLLDPLRCTLAFCLGISVRRAACFGHDSAVVRVRRDDGIEQIKPGQSAYPWRNVIVHTNRYMQEPRWLRARPRIQPTCAHSQVVVKVHRMPMK